MMRTILADPFSEVDRDRYSLSLSPTVLDLGVKNIGS